MSINAEVKIGRDESLESLIKRFNKVLEDERVDIRPPRFKKQSAIGHECRRAAKHKEMIGKIIDRKKRLKRSQRGYGIKPPVLNREEKEKIAALTHGGVRFYFWPKRDRVMGRENVAKYKK